MNEDLLSRHHAELDRHIDALLTTSEGGDSHDLATAWRAFERELLNHFTLEEEKLFPRFVLEDPEEVAALKQQHEALKRDSLALGIRADLHSLAAEAVRTFIVELRAHAAREEQSLYRWAHTNVDSDTWSTIAHGLREARETLMHKLAEELGRLGAKTL